MTGRSYRLLAATAWVVHVVVVASILRQPLDVNRHAERSLVWPLHVDTTHRRGPGADFFGVYAAGIQPRAREGIYVDISDPHVPVGVPYGYPFRYLPIVAQTLSPLLRILPPRSAYIAWVLVTEIVCFAALSFLWKRAANDALRGFTAATLLLSTPYFLELTMGQFTFVAIALVLRSMAVLEARGRSVVSWIAFGVAAVLKLFPLVVAPALLRLRGGWKIVAATVAFIAATSTLYFGTHPGVLEAFLDINTGGKMDGLDAGNHGFLYVVHRLTRDVVQWTPPSWTKVAAAWQAVLLVGTAALVYTAKRCSALYGGAVLVVAFVLSYVHVWEHHYSATLLAALVVLHRFVADDGGWSTRARVVAVAIVLLAVPTPFVLLDPHPEPSLWDPSPRWGALAFLPPLSKVLPAALVLALAVRALATDGFELPVWVRRRDASTTVA